MIGIVMKIFSCIFIAFFSFSSYAEQNIRITVKTNANDISGLGYIVEGKKIGGRGDSYSGNGPINKQYKFGYRTRLPFLTDISCGTQTLTRDSTIILVTDGKNCHSIVKDSLTKS